MRRPLREMKMGVWEKCRLLSGNQKAACTHDGSVLAVAACSGSLHFGICLL